MHLVARDRILTQSVSIFLADKRKSFLQSRSMSLTLINLDLYTYCWKMSFTFPRLEKKHYYRFYMESSQKQGPINIQRICQLILNYIRISEILYRKSDCSFYYPGNPITREFLSNQGSSRRSDSYYRITRLKLFNTCIYLSIKNTSSLQRSRGRATDAFLARCGFQFSEIIEDRRNGIHGKRKDRNHRSVVLEFGYF